MDTKNRRYRAFISYSQRDKAVTRRLHRKLETYRIPKGVQAPVGPDRRLGRFFRDDDEMGASKSLGAALEGALDDSENLIVVCSPSAAQSKWVDVEVRHFKARGDAGVFAIIAAGEAHATSPDRECFPPSLKVKINAEGVPTDEPDEPRAPDLHRDGIQKVCVQVAAGLLNIPFDELWRRDRRRARQIKVFVVAFVMLVLTVIGIAGLGWYEADNDARVQAAQRSIGLARNASAEGRIDEALNRLTPFLEHRATRGLVERPLRALLGWAPNPAAHIAPTGLQPVRLLDATVLLDPGRGAYDISDIGLELKRLIWSRDARRIVAFGAQRVVVLDAGSGERLGHVDNHDVEWLGHAFEAPNGQLIVTGAVLGPTNGSVRPFALSVSSDGRTVQRLELNAHMFWGSAVGVTPSCDKLLLAAKGNDSVWQVEARSLTGAKIAEPTGSASFRADDDLDAAGIDGLAEYGMSFETRNAFLRDVAANPFTKAGCLAVGSDEGATAGELMLQGVSVVSLDLALGFEKAIRWVVSEGGQSAQMPHDGYTPNCTVADPCPIIGGWTDLTYVYGELPRSSGDRYGRPPPSRWSKRESLATMVSEPVYFEHLVFNSRQQMTVCRPMNGRDSCLQISAVGEEFGESSFLRSPNGRYLYWPFGGAVVDLETLQTLTPTRGIPWTDTEMVDFETDRAGLTIVVDGRLVSYAPATADGPWVRTDEERASPRFDVLAPSPSEAPFHTLASLGDRQYLAVRVDGVIARLDAVSGEQIWRVNAVGLGGITDVQLDPERNIVLLMGKSAWRMFRLSDGFPISALLAPPAVLNQSKPLTDCQLEDAVGPEGQLLVSCGAQTFKWQPRNYEDDIDSQLAKLTCASDASDSTRATIQRCFVDR